MKKTTEENTLSRGEQESIKEAATLQVCYIESIKHNLKQSQVFDTAFGRLAYYMISDYEYDINFDVVDDLDQVLWYWDDSTSYIQELAKSVQTFRNTLINSYLTYLDDTERIERCSKEYGLDSINDDSHDYYGMYGGSFVDLDSGSKKILTELTKKQTKELNSLLNGAGFNSVADENSLDSPVRSIVHKTK